MPTPDAGSVVNVVLSCSPGEPLPDVSDDAAQFLDREDFSFFSELQGFVGPSPGRPEDVSLEVGLVEDSWFSRQLHSSRLRKSAG